MSLRHLVFHNFWLKIFSIALGTIIWMAIHFSMDHNIALAEPGPRQLLIKETIEVPIDIMKQEGDPRPSPSIRAMYRSPSAARPGRCTARKGEKSRCMLT